MKLNTLECEESSLLEYMSTHSGGRKVTSENLNENLPSHLKVCNIVFEQRVKSLKYFHEFYEFQSPLVKGIQLLKYGDSNIFFFSFFHYFK